MSEPIYKVSIKLLELRPNYDGLICHERKEIGPFNDEDDARRAYHQAIKQFGENFEVENG